MVFPGDVYSRLLIGEALADNNDDFEFITYRRPISEYINMLTDIELYIRKSMKYRSSLNSKVATTSRAA